MTTLSDRLRPDWTQVALRYLPFADAASPSLPLSRLLRLSLFQVSVGMAVVLLNGVLNRVMIAELSVSAALVSSMIALPLVIAPLRVLIGHRSDTYHSALGWRRVPFIWFGSLLQFGGLAIMPFALIILSGDTHGPLIIGDIAAALAFFLVGIGLHTTQTAGLALATDLAAPEQRPRVVALLYVMLLIGMVFSALIFSALLADFSQIRLIQVVQGAAAVTMVLNVVALWKQEVRRPSDPATPAADFRSSWNELVARPGFLRFLWVVALGTAAFSMQDVLLEPYGGQVLGLSVGGTTLLTALFAAGSLVAFTAAAAQVRRGSDPNRLAAVGALIGVTGFSAVIFADPLHSATLFRMGTFSVGFGAGLFGVCTLISAMALDDGERAGLVLGAWGAAQAFAAGAGIFAGGMIRDIVSGLATAGYLGPALTEVSVGYSVVYHLEIGLLFATLIALGPLVRSGQCRMTSDRRFGLADLPG